MSTKKDGSSIAPLYQYGCVERTTSGISGATDKTSGPSINLVLISGLERLNRLDMMA